MNLKNFVYGTGWINLLAVIGDVNQAVVNIASDASFRINYLAIAVEQAGVIILNWAGLIQINDSAMGQTFFDIPVPVDSLRGAGGLPYPMNPPRMVKANASLTVALTQSIAVVTNVFVSFQGEKLL